MMISAQENIWLFYLLIGLVSLAVGSLLNVIIYRLPLMLHAEWVSQCNELLQLSAPPAAPQPNLFFPRSFCPNCKKSIPAWHNIPIVSYLLLKGRCATCQQAIPVRYLLVEVGCLLLSLLGTWLFGFTLSLPFILLFIWISIVLFVIDLRHQMLPDNLTLSLLWIGLIANTQGLFTSLTNAVLSAAGGYLALWLFVKLYYLLTKKMGMGHGDFKLFAAYGAWFGWIQLPFILLLSSLLGAIVGLFYLRKTDQSKETPIPFGPFLCVASFISLFFGKPIMSWYLHWY